MKLYSQCNLNSVTLEPYPFKMEIVMEAFLVENPSLLSFGSDEIPEIIDYELPVENGRKKGNGRIDILARYSEKLYAVIELKKGLLDLAAYKQLREYISNKEQFKDKNLEKSKLCGILIGTQITDEVQKLISENKIIEGNVCAAVVINRYKNSKDGQIFITSDFYGKIAEKDYSKYSFNGGEYNKRELIKAVVNDVVLNSPEISYEELKSVFSDKMLVRAVKRIEEIPEKSKKNYFDDVITLKDGIKVAVCNDWGTNFDKVLQALQKIYPDIYKI